VTLPETVF